jgi:hypothetical protein
LVDPLHAVQEDLALGAEGVAQGPLPRVALGGGLLEGPREPGPQRVGAEGADQGAVEA